MIKLTFLMTFFAPLLLLNNANAWECHKLECGDKLNKIKFENHTDHVWQLTSIEYMCGNSNFRMQMPRRNDKGSHPYRCCCSRLRVGGMSNCKEGCHWHRDWTSDNCKKQGDGTNIRITGGLWPAKVRVKGWCHAPEHIPGP